MILAASSRLQLVVLVGELLLEVSATYCLVDGEDEHLVVGEQALLDGLAEAEAVELRAVQGLVVHRRQLGVVLLRPWSWLSSP